MADSGDLSSPVRSRIRNLEKQNDQARGASFSLSPAGSPRSNEDGSTSSLSTAARVQFFEQKKTPANKNSTKNVNSYTAKTEHNRKATIMARAHLRPRAVTTPSAASPAPPSRSSTPGSAGTASTATVSSSETDPKAKVTKSAESSPDRPASNTQQASVIRINRLQALLEEKATSPKIPRKTTVAKATNKASTKVLPAKLTLSPKSPIPNPKNDLNDPNSPSAISLRNLQQKTSFHQRILGLAENHVQHQSKAQSPQGSATRSPSQQQQSKLLATVAPQQRQRHNIKGPSPAALMRGAALSREIDPTSPRSQSSSVKSSARKRTDGSLAFSPERVKQSTESVSPKNRQPLLAAVNNSPMARIRGSHIRQQLGQRPCSLSQVSSISTPSLDFVSSRETMHSSNIINQDAASAGNSVGDNFCNEPGLQKPPSLQQHLLTKHAGTMSRLRQQQRPLSDSGVHKQRKQQLRPRIPLEQEQHVPDDELFVPQFDDFFAPTEFRPQQPKPQPDMHSFPDFATDPDFLPERDYFVSATPPREPSPERRRQRAFPRRERYQASPESNERQSTSPRHKLRLQKHTLSQMSHKDPSQQSQSSSDTRQNETSQRSISPDLQQSPPGLPTFSPPRSPPTFSQTKLQHESFPHAESQYSTSPARSLTQSGYLSASNPDRRHKRNRSQHDSKQSQLSPSTPGRDANLDEDEMTLTSVRRIVDPQQESVIANGTNPTSGMSQKSIRSHRSESSSRHQGNRCSGDTDVFEEKKSEPTRGIRGTQTTPQSEKLHQPSDQEDSSSSEYEMDYATENSVGGRGGQSSRMRSYEESATIRSSSTKEQQASLSMSASAMTPEFFEQHADHQRPSRALHRNGSRKSSRKRLGHVASGTSTQNATARPTDDDETYDYGCPSEDEQNGADNQSTHSQVSQNSHQSNYSLSYEQRRLKQVRETKVREAAIAKAKQEMEDTSGGGFMQKEKVDKYRRNIDTPLTRTAVGVAAAATVGCIVLGPVGLLVGAAAVGIGIGYMEIPEEQRRNIQSKTADAVNNAQESIIKASEKMSNSCALTYRESGFSDHVPVEIQTCCTELGMSGLGDKDGALGVADDNDGSVILGPDEKLQHGFSRDWAVIGDQARSMSKHGGILVSSPTHDGGTGRFGDKNKRNKVACLRKGKIVPVAQIHSLDPSSQPRAWVDVISSADTEVFEKIEAVEEILILAKDKNRTRLFVDEGILDSIMWIIDRYFEKVRRGPGWEKWAFPEIGKDEARLAKLAANCCLTLGKSYCAAIHTEGDLLLMSLYERGTVPEERQLAQMLHEVQHHTRATQTDDPTIVTPGHELFALKQLTLPQAEEAAASIYGLATGQPDLM